MFAQLDQANQRVMQWRYLSQSCMSMRRTSFRKEVDVELRILNDTVLKWEIAALKVGNALPFLL
jgi:hypothetical protein